MAPRRFTFQLTNRTLLVTFISYDPNYAPIRTICHISVLGHAQTECLLSFLFIHSHPMCCHECWYMPHYNILFLKIDEYENFVRSNTGDVCGLLAHISGPV